MKFDAQQKQQVYGEITERFGDVRAHIAPEAEIEPDAGTDALWQTWLTTTSQLQELGVSPKALCDASNGVSEVHREFEGAREETRTA